MSNLALVLQARGKLGYRPKLDEAEALSRQGPEVQRRVLGPEHPNTLTAMSLLALVLEARGKLDEAEPL